MKTIHELFLKYKSCKVVFTLEVEFFKVAKFVSVIHKTCLFTSGSSIKETGQIINSEKDFINAYNTGYEIIKEKIEKWMKEGSDWIIKNIPRMIIKVVKYQPYAGASYIEFQNKNCINIKNDDNKCFDYSFLCSVYHDEIGNKDLQRVSKYKNYMNKIDRTGIEYPVKLDDIETYEKNNGFPINVLKYVNGGEESVRGVFSPCSLGKKRKLLFPL